MRIPKLLLETWKRTGKQSLSVALAWAIAFAPAVATAQEKSPEQKAASTSQLPAPVSKPLTNAEGGAAKLERPGGPQEGIKVHGHWVLEVRNPDGSLASRSEFENALVPTTGTNLLAALLTRGVSFGWFEIQIGDTSPS